MGTNGTFQISHTRAGANGVTSAIQQASAKTGVDFGYLVNQAKVESSMNPNAKARTSSATGLYQFIDQTWLRMMKAHGAEHGYGHYANAITQGSDGDFHVANRATRNAILNLRKDPKASSLMAAELATENNAYLRQTVGGEPSGTDLYMAHFLGAQGASNFLNSMKKNPWAPAASFFPDAARSNRGVFYAQGRPLSLQQVYNNFDARMNGGSATPVSDTMVASNNFENKVILPLANDWSNPNSVAAARAAHYTQSNTQAMVAAFTGSDNAAQNTSTGFGQRVAWPMEALFTAQSGQMNFAHDDNARYNS